MSNAAEKIKAVKINKCIGVRVDCDFNLYGYGIQDLEDEIKTIESRIQDFQEFIKDHRSQDDITLCAVREYEEQCSLCGEGWDEVNDEDGHYCGNCGVEI